MPDVVWVFLLALWPFTFGLPSMRDSLTNPVHVYEGDDALITCVVRDIGENTVMWKKEDRERHSRRVLTAGDSRVTADRRYSVLHDSVSSEEKDVPTGGDVWVLVIKNSKPSDSGIYVCEVNSNPIVRSFHKLSVLSKALLPPENGTDANVYEDQKASSFNSKNHNYTDCCISKNVSSSCLGFCNIQSILEGNTGQDPEHCEADFPNIVRCMADGRNHVPCCIQERVPDICQDVCRGEYTAITDNIKTHFSCSAYTEQTLACIVEGIELLPNPPQDVEVEALTEKSLRVSWAHPDANTETVTEYSINVTSLKTFDERLIEPTESNPSRSSDSHTVHVNVPSTQNETVLNDLSPFTMYEVTVSALNIHGSSLPSYRVRSLTLTPGKIKPTMAGTSPKLPDVKGCCMKKGIGHRTCVDKLCDPSLADTAEITDLMICAPWAADTFSCLTNGMDHTPCCKARGLPEICQQLCTGNVTTIDFNYFKCLRYMGDYTNCLLQGYGVLPSTPTGVHVTNIETEFAILHWSAPRTLGDTVIHYNVHFRMFSAFDDEDYKSIAKVHSPYILEGLESDTDYEFYIEAVNTHGVGEPSTRIAFRTSSKIYEAKVEEASNYNVTACCVEAELSSVCLPLCSYDANMSDIKTLAGVCSPEFTKLLRCGAGGRNHGACCTRRGVPASCVSLCNGVMVDSLLVTATTCIPYIGNIAQCFEEGTGLLPGPISELHATVIDDEIIALEWEPPTDPNNVTDYVIHYQKVDNTSMHETLLKLDKQINTTDTSAILNNLDRNSIYHIFVVARNVHGTSLPSSIIMINVTKSDGELVSGVTSPPHSLAVSTHSATWVTITWQPPEFSHPSESITYRLYHKSTTDSVFQITNTSVTSHTIQNLLPNTQYIVYVTATSKKGQSMPSETLIAWTDPAYPAFVEPPTVHPINLVIEGSSMTILCIAMGTPMPTISLYISGRLVRQEITRHMVTVIHNVTRDMDQISCYADNGYGTPMQASRKITISHGPHIQASGITMAAPGDSVTLECKVDAQPGPKMIFWKNHEERKPVIQGGKYDISISASKDDEDKYMMHLTINNIGNMDVGDYFCHAENAFGSATQPVSVRLRNLATTHNVTQCCMEQNVSSQCMDACSFYLDMDAVIDKAECINDFDKLMKCAADGSDHRNCCAQKGVPRGCLDWCRGGPLNDNKNCVLSYTKLIMGCFHEGRDKLPGPPQNVRVEKLDMHSAKIVWDEPVKNPHTVEMYRVFWKIMNSDMKRLQKDTPNTYIDISDLQHGETYDCVIKAGNNKGTSTLSQAIQFTVGAEYITSAANSDDSSHTGVAFAIVLALVVVAGVVVGGVWLVKTKQMGVKNQGGVAFENPSYLREVNMDHIQVPPTQAESTNIPNGTANGIAVSTTSGGHGWKQESLHVPAQHEVNPTLYEELKLGQDGAGFKRLKP
ncbi:PREDICTED: Ig-like and fibronectin type-III domain-containing protein 2 isoform X2 [Nicrophorus vespilloides]|uniref:Ig-like and fibronectin type-III domain-containing protein 2 isoform X2 n=1 Tax=Nicrophorus vespilloides TaxID=110193 RepID=A0ABM1N980_NICVS|nr:PREDICTED: Ig-like and fibronectin type-III domain-containing protein 2 isoform X2 [Nicrophorus vespilloides]